MWVDTLQKEALLEWNVAGITETSSFPGEKKSLLLLCMCSTFWENSSIAFMRGYFDLNQGQAVNLDGR